MERLEAAYSGEGKAEVFAVLKAVLGHLNRSGPSSQDLAAALGMSEGAVRVAVHRLRKRYRRILKEEIALTLDDESEAAVEEELRYIFGCSPIEARHEGHLALISGARDDDLFLLFGALEVALEKGLEALGNLHHIGIV